MHQAACCPLPLTQEHWFTVRCLWGEWWNLNSLFPAPQPLGQFYLSAFLASLQEQGYQILVVRSRSECPRDILDALVMGPFGYGGEPRSWRTEPYLHYPIGQI